MTRTDVEGDLILGTFVVDPKTVDLGSDDVYQEEVDVPLIDRTDLVIPDLEFILRHEQENYLPPLVEGNEDGLICVGNNGFLKAHKNVGTGLIYAHLVRPIFGQEVIPTEVLAKRYALGGPLTDSPKLARDRSTFLFFEKRGLNPDSRMFLQHEVDMFAESVTGKPTHLPVTLYHAMGVARIPNRYGSLDIQAQKKLTQGLQDFYASLENTFGPLRSINGEKVDH